MRQVMNENPEIGTIGILHKEIIKGNGLNHNPFMVSGIKKIKCEVTDSGIGWGIPIQVKLLEDGAGFKKGHILSVGGKEFYID